MHHHCVTWRGGAVCTPWCDLHVPRVPTGLPDPPQGHGWPRENRRPGCCHGNGPPIPGIAIATGLGNQATHPRHHHGNHHTHTLGPGNRRRWQRGAGRMLSPWQRSWVCGGLGGRHSSHEEPRGSKGHPQGQPGHGASCEGTGTCKDTRTSKGRGGGGDRGIEGEGLCEDTRTRGDTRGVTRTRRITRTCDTERT